MKTKKIFSFLMILLFSILLVACNNNTDEDKINFIDITEDSLETMSSLDAAKYLGNGINLGNTLEATDRQVSGLDKTPIDYETLWRQPETTKDLIKGMKEAGFDSLRIPVSWTNTMDYENDNFEISPAYLERVATIANWALDEDMFVVINDHWDGGWWAMFGSSDQTLRARAEKLYEELWKQVGNYFKDYSYRLILESGNEELGERLNDEYDGKKGVLNEEQTYSETNRINQKFVDLIRKQGGKNANRFLLIAGYNTDIKKTLDERFEMPTDTAKDKLFISVHFYDPSAYTINEGIENWEVKYFYEEQNRLLQSMTAFTEKGYGVIIGEYGVIPKSERVVKNNTVDYTKNLLHNMDLYGYVPMLWDDTNGIFDRENFKLIDDDLAKLYLDMRLETEKTMTDKQIIDKATKGLEDGLLNAKDDGVDRTKAHAWIMYAGKDWAVTYNVGDYYNPQAAATGVVATDAVVDSVGSFTVKLDLSETNAQDIEFLALGIYNGETLYAGYAIHVTNFKVNGQTISISTAHYTTSDDDQTTRVNLYNAWVSNDALSVIRSGNDEVARIWNNAELRNATATPIGSEKYVGAIQTIELTFRLVRK